MIQPHGAAPLPDTLAPAFTQPTHRRFVTLLLAAVPTAGRSAVANLLRSRGALTRGHRSD